MTLEVRVRASDLASLDSFRAAFRREAGCQIVRDSILDRGLADPWLIQVASEPVGYAGIWNEHFPGRLMELYLTAEVRAHAVDIVGAVLAASGATRLEAQTNLPLMREVLHAWCPEPEVENLLFADGPSPPPAAPGFLLRERAPSDVGPDGEWVLERAGEVVAAGGLLGHYNPPYRDLYMEVGEAHRRQGVGATIVGELRRVCRAAGHVPAARCGPANEASRRTLERGGMVPCGEILAGVARSRPDQARATGDTRSRRAPA